MTMLELTMNSTYSVNHKKFVERRKPKVIDYVNFFLAMVVLGLMLYTLTGCGSMIADGRQSNAPGQAAYSLEKTEDGGCKVWITSGREVEQGTVEIGSDCTVKASASSLSGKEMQLQQGEIIKELIGKVPLVAP